MVIVLFLSKSAGGREKGDESMARILTVDPEQARGLRKLMVRLISRQTGGMFPGIFQIIMRDFQVAIPTTWLYSYLNERKGSPLSRLQREMVATVVNGLVGGAP
jgi:hypothetical protein